MVLSFNPSSHHKLEGFVEADYARYRNDRRSTGGYCVYFGGNLVIWNSKKQSLVSRSSAELEYRALANITTEVLWVQSLCQELGIATSTPHQIWCDNSSKSYFTCSNYKHIEVDVHFVREKIQDKTVEVGHVPATDQIVDLFTKPLPEQRFCLLQGKLKLLIPPSAG